METHAGESVGPILTFALPDESGEAEDVRGTRGTSGRVITRVALTAAAYYVGARVGFFFQSSLVPQSVLWLPNSILLAALILARPREWLLFFLAAFPAQLVVGWQTHAPLLTMSLIFITNCADAALGATLWRVISPDERRMQGLRSMLAFLAVVATVPTILMSFADAAITIGMGWSSHYWLVFATRARANVLTNVLFVPAAVSLLDGSRHALAAQLRKRSLEGVAILLGLIITSLLAFFQPPGSISSAALAYLPLIFVVWSAMRFNVTMTGTSLLALAYLTTWFGSRGLSVAATRSTDDIVPALQFELLAIAVPVLCLCAVVQDKDRASAALAASQRALHESLGEIRALAARLLTATEQERARIALELHDDVSQRLAALGIGLSALKRHMPNDEKLRDEVGALQTQAMRAADDVRILSHELHPASLRHGGLVPAMRDLCQQFGRGGTMHAVFVGEPDIEVSDDVALCIYRVTQEALRNAARHSGAADVEVRLVNAKPALELWIADSGSGFDARVAREYGGLGLTSMAERVRLIGGTLRLDTAPGRGTRILLRLPNHDAHVSPDASFSG